MGRQLVVIGIDTSYSKDCFCHIHLSFSLCAVGVHSRFDMMCGFPQKICDIKAQNKGQMFGDVLFSCSIPTNRERTRDRTHQYRCHTVFLYNMTFPLPSVIIATDDRWFCYIMLLVYQMKQNTKATLSKLTLTCHLHRSLNIISLMVRICWSKGEMRSTDRNHICNKNCKQNFLCVVKVVSVLNKITVSASHNQHCAALVHQVHKLRWWQFI